MDNVIDGMITAPVTSNQEGIESYGGRDVTVARNVVRNIGNTALNFGSAGLPDTGIERLRVVQNVVTNSGRGLNIGPWLDSSGPQNIADVLIEDNEFGDLWSAGMFVPVQRGSADRQHDRRRQLWRSAGVRLERAAGARRGHLHRRGGVWRQRRAA